MPRAAKQEAKEPGLYKNGRLWWVRQVRAPLSGQVRALSTGTEDLTRANAIRRKLTELAENRQQWEWLDAAVAGDIKLGQLYDNAAAGTLHLLREQRAAAFATAQDTDLEPLVDQWVKQHLAVIELSDETRHDYERDVRRFIPAGVRFPKSQFTEDYVKATLAGFTGARHDATARLSATTKVHKLAALKLFVKWLRKRVEFIDPLADGDWQPKPGAPRSTFHEYDKVKLVLAQLEGEHKAAAALVYGSGIELGALLAQVGAHVGSPEERTIVAPGTKNDHRRDRTIFVRQWAWDIFYAYAQGKSATEPLWSYLPSREGSELRDAFYWAQVKAGLIAEPEKSADTHKLLWGRVKPHTLHDARHSYCINTSLGLDGEAPEDATFCAHQLGHATEDMVLRIYKKANVKERLRLLRLRRSQQAEKAGEGK